MVLEFAKLSEQNPWWRGAEEAENDYDVEKWRAKRFKWVPKFVQEFVFEPFALHVLLGPRQTGKTTAVKLLVRQLLKEKNVKGVNAIDAKSVFYFNCEEIGGFNELMEVVEAYLQYRDSLGLKSSLLVLDEVTAPKEWFRGVKALLDKGKLKNDVVLLTGSSSIAVKRQVELFPGRRGNGKDFVLLPLSFRGFLSIVNQRLHDKIKPVSHLSELEAKAAAAAPFENELNKELIEFLKYGGFPLSVEALGGSNEEAKRACLSSIKNAVLKAERSDLIARQVLSAFVSKMPSAVSWEGVSKEIEVKSPKTVAAYADLLKNIFALIVLYNVDVSGKRIKFGKNKKVHAADPLLLEVFEDWCLSNVKNKEAVLAESVAAAHLSRLCPENAFFWRNGSEVDIVVAEKKALHGFEVKWSDNRKLEALEAEAKAAVKPLPQLKSFTLLSKRGFRVKPLVVPLAVFLSLLDV